MGDDPELRRLLWFLLGGSRGGLNRARIIQKLRERPHNLNQLANELKIQYKAVQHHARVLLRSALLMSTVEKYGVTYFLSPWLDGHFEIFEEICAKLRIDPATSRSGE